MEIFEHEHQRRFGSQHFKSLGELAHHPRSHRPLQPTLEPLQLRLAHQSWELRQPHRRTLPQHRQHVRPMGSTPQLPQSL